MGKIWKLDIADLHIGSVFALWPDDFKGSGGVVPNLNKGQLYLLDHWRKIEKVVFEMIGDDPFILCVVGDTHQGKNRKDEGRWLTETSTEVQGFAAIHLLKTYANRADQVFMFQGTRYHVDNGEAEEFIGYTLRSVQDDLGRHCWAWLPDLNVEGVIFDIAHHQSVTIVNRAMPLEREQRHAAIIADMKEDGMPHLIVRAHVHTGSYVEVDGRASLSLLPMQIQGRYAEGSKTPNRYVSRWLGVTLIEILPDNLDSFMNPFAVHWMRFRHPQLASRTFAAREEAKCSSKKGLLSRILR